MKPDHRLVQDCAYCGALHVVELVGHLLRDEERAEFFWEVFARIQGAIEAYREFKAQEVEKAFRAKPGEN